MARVKCKACGERYDYHEHGCCPGCGAYNRPPQRNRVGADGVVHHMSDADFMDNTAKRRNSQSGKVCFEREECHEDQVRRGFSRAKSEKKRNPAKTFVTVVAVVVLINVIPLLLTMCSVSGVFGEIVDELFGSEVGWDEPVEVPEWPAQPMPDLAGAELIAPGRSFLWGEEMACVTEVTMGEFDDVTNVLITVQVDDPAAKPSVYYQLPDGTQAVADCQEGVLLDSGEYLYAFKLPDRQPGSACYALFTGQTDGEWRMYELPLTEYGNEYVDDDVTDPDDDVNPDDVKPDSTPDTSKPDNGTSDKPATDSGTQAPAVLTSGTAKMGQTFLWWGEEAAVTKASVHESGNSADINVTMQRADDFAAPVLRYTNKMGFEMMAFAQETTALGGGKYHYFFHVDDRKPGSTCYAVFTGYTADVHCEVVVVLN